MTVLLPLASLLLLVATKERPNRTTMRLNGHKLRAEGVIIARMTFNPALNLRPSAFSFGGSTVIRGIIACTRSAREVEKPGNKARFWEVWRKTPQLLMHGDSQLANTRAAAALVSYH